MPYWSFIKYLLPAILSFFASWYVFVPVLRLAMRKNLVDNPDARKLQKMPVPVMGGVAVYFGIVCGLLLASSMFNLTLCVPVLTSMTILLLVGVVDDQLGITAKKRLIIEVLTILGMIFGGMQCIDSLHGLWGIGTFSWYIAVPLTVVGCVGIINAINMIDGVNGLSSGLCITCSLFFAFLFNRGGDAANAILNILMAFALVPFWIHNVIGKKTRMFIGDAGTMAMGGLMSWNVIQVLGDTQVSRMLTETGNCHVAVVLAILSVPVADTLRVMTMRVFHGQSPFSPDRTHLHHIIYDYGKSHSITAFTEVGITILINAAYILSYVMGASLNTQFLVVFVLAAFLVWGLYALLSFNYRLNTRFAYRARKVLASMRQGETNWWKRAQAWVDRGLKDVD